MPFKLFYLASYMRCLKRLAHKDKHVAGLTIDALQLYLNSESLASDKPYAVNLKGRGYRLVFKKLRPGIWEAYIEGKLRILTQQEKGSHFLVFVGNHDQVRQFLKNF